MDINPYLALSITGLFSGLGSGLGVVLAQKFYEKILTEHAKKAATMLNKWGKKKER